MKKYSIDWQHYKRIQIKKSPLGSSYDETNSCQLWWFTWHKNHHPMKGIIFKEDVALKEPQSKPFNEWFAVQLLPWYQRISKEQWMGEKGEGLLCWNSVKMITVIWWRKFKRPHFRCRFVTKILNGGTIEKVLMKSVQVCTIASWWVVLLNEYVKICNNKISKRKRLTLNNSNSNASRSIQSSP